MRAKFYICDRLPENRAARVNVRKNQLNSLRCIKLAYGRERLDRRAQYLDADNSVSTKKKFFWWGRVVPDFAVYGYIYMS